MCLLIPAYFRLMFAIWNTSPITYRVTGKQVLYSNYQVLMEAAVE